MREELLNKLSVDELLAGAVIQGLNSHFNELVSTLISSDATAISVDDLLIKLREHENRTQNNREIDSSGSKALTVKGENPSKKTIQDQIDSAVNKKLAEAFLAGASHPNSTHRYNDDRRYQQPRGKGKGKKKGFPHGVRKDYAKGGKGEKICYNCRGIGHLASQCPSKKIEREAATPNATPAAETPVPKGKGPK